MSRSIALSTLTALAVVTLAACQTAAQIAPHGAAGHTLAVAHSPEPTAAAPSGVGATPAVNLKTLSSLDGIIPTLASKRVVYVGETHDRFDNHLNQLEIIRRLYAIHPDLAVGMEYFQQPFQRYLDQYIAGELDERQMLRKTEYYDRWRFDFRLYAPILRYLREHHIPAVALNLPQEITHKVGREGLASLSEAQRAQIPKDIDRSDNHYRERLMEIFAQHPMRKGASFENFLDVQLLWDEGMAARVARYLERNPARPMVVLAGSGHLVYGAGIPKRVQRRIKVDSAIVLNGGEDSIEPDIADFLLFPQAIDLPPAGTLGVILESTANGVKIGSVSPNSAAQAAGIKAGDRLLSLNGEPVADVADVRSVLWDKRPGDKVAVLVRRKPWLWKETELPLEVVLR